MGANTKVEGGKNGIDVCVATRDAHKSEKSGKINSKHAGVFYITMRKIFHYWEALKTVYNLHGNKHLTSLYPSSECALQKRAIYANIIGKIINVALCALIVMFFWGG